MQSNLATVAQGRIMPASDTSKIGPMPKKHSTTGSELFIVDNSETDWKVRRYLHDWCDLSKAFDIATGYFDIGGLLCLDGEWQKVDAIRILMGDEVHARTSKAFADAFDKRKKALDASIEAEKADNDFLTGVPAIVQAIRDKKILCRVYKKNKFHAKAYITHARKEVIGSAALVGSSNFTHAGLNNNVELNVQITGAQVSVLQEWFEHYWQESEEVTADILKLIERHTREYEPFEVYARFLHEFFRHYDVSKDLQAWLDEPNGSAVWKRLDDYQKEAFFDLLSKAAKHKGALLCDGVGLGKTLTGLMLVEYYVEFLRKRVVLMVPKAANETVWQPSLKEFAPRLYRMVKSHFGRLAIRNHTDLQRKASDDLDYPAFWEAATEDADMILIDEAHHFRNTGVKGEGVKKQSRYWKFFEVAEGKTLFMLTATPINNRLIDLQHMIELITHGVSDYFKLTLGINSIPGHFRTLEKAVDKLLDGDPSNVEANAALTQDKLFRELVVQRSRGYAIESQKRQGKSGALFPKREVPKVGKYSLEKTYGKLLKLVDAAFKKEKPLLNLSIYYPLFYYEGEETEELKWERGRQEEVAALIRTQFLKRFESCWASFEDSCCRLLVRVYGWIQKQTLDTAEAKSLDRWKRKYPNVLEQALVRRKELVGIDDDDEVDEDVILEEEKANWEALQRGTYRLGEMVGESIEDLHELAAFLEELKDITEKDDDKLKTLVKLLKTDPVLSKHKVLIFTEYMATARYLETQLKKAGITNVDEVDSARANHGQRVPIIQRFSPYYNGTTSKELADAGVTETRVLISTDVLSEGLNLQDATRMVNYDLHWNPVRLMQRIGRVDRRLNQKHEDAILRDHPEQKEVRGTTGYWNFLPPKELDELLLLFGRVHKKVLRISKTFGIEGKKLLTPEDDFDALREFNQKLDDFGKTPYEDMRRAYNALKDADPILVSSLAAQPGKVFSGKAHIHPNTQTVLFCFVIPGPPLNKEGGIRPDAPADEWSEDHGRTVWLRYEVATSKIDDNAPDMMPTLKCEPATPRVTKMPEKTLSEIRAEVEKHLKHNHLKAIQAPVSVRPGLKAWMELN